MKFMKLKIAFSVLLALLFSCQKDDGKLLAEQLKENKRKQVVFANINNNWIFINPPLSATSKTVINDWNELRNFVTELTQKPKSSIGEFQKKAKILSNKVKELNNNIPVEFDEFEIKTRIGVLTTKINSLNLFINLQTPQDKKVVALVAEINQEMQSFYRQMDEIIRKNEIPMEDGESDLMMMKDTTRAISDAPSELE
jgi:hypothetical protein